MAKIALEFEPNAGRAIDPTRRSAARILAQGNGWSVSDMTCSAGPRDRPFEEQHAEVCVAIVIAGSFQYRSSPGRELMTSGSLLLGNAGQYFECGHEHGVGDRCISFSYAPRYFESLAGESGVARRSARFSKLRVPAVRELSSLVAQARAGLAEFADRPVGREQITLSAGTEKFAPRFLEDAGDANRHSTAWEEMGVALAAQALDFGSGDANQGSLPAAEARVTRIVRMMESCPNLDLGLASLAREAKLSRFHFLRVFQQLTGLTPHRYIVRARLRQAATRLLREPGRVLDIALDSGFGDVSNFNHAFRAEFGVSPRSYRKNAGYNTKESFRPRSSAS